ncbi:hypothetical protein [Sphingomonas sp. Leaf10]|uniref:hypothetical protein n=1 Tax=Sphingomonas sp. Leaf10 TaxID=1735676 RepID=UPI0007142717|nr:hypothetical protein [Sphingomonas sp. Leaf10]KQM37974.1 hypothetical protein ASE59_11795 [Sphingomonas sp. Leaf10]
MISESTNRAGMCFIDRTPILIPNLRRYWRDPQPFEAERTVRQAELNDRLTQRDAHCRERIWAMIEREKKA